MTYDVHRSRDVRNPYRDLVQKLKGMKSFEKTRLSWEVS
jgi:hypothetical protein